MVQDVAVVVDEGAAFRVVTDPSVVFDVKAALDDAGIEGISADAPLVSDNLVLVTDSGDARSVLRVIEALEDNDDVQDVFSNFDMADDVLEAAAS